MGTDDSVCVGVWPDAGFGVVGVSNAQVEILMYYGL